MSIYSLCTVTDPTMECSFCLEPLMEIPCFAHSGQGTLHPIHKKCAEDWHQIMIKEIQTIIRPNCPACNVLIDIDSLLTREEQNIIKARRVKVEKIATVAGLTAGIVAATAAIAIIVLWINAELKENFKVTTLARVLFGMKGMLGLVVSGPIAVVVVLAGGGVGIGVKGLIKNLLQR